MSSPAKKTMDTSSKTAFEALAKASTVVPLAPARPGVQRTSTVENFDPGGDAGQKAFVPKKKAQVTRRFNAKGQEIKEEQK